ncbi:MAG: MlaD family protein [Candidatus Margulisiibacteriota bacterium]|jgi:phospholipid/cholesterol/gamma-HCH transport system substrate-binding protein
MNTAAKVGLVTFLGILCLTSLLIWKSGIVTSIQGYEITGSFRNINGLMEGAEVRYRGFRIGTVTRITPRAEDIRVIVKVSKQIDIPRDSTLRVEFDGLIGEKYIGVLPGLDTTRLYAPGIVLKGISSAGIVDFVDVGTQNLDETKKILALFYKMLEDGSIQHSVKKILSNVEVTTQELNKLIPSLMGIADNLSTLADSISPMLSDPSIHANLRVTVQNIKEASGEISSFASGLNSSMSEVTANVNQMLVSIKKASDSINDVLKDGELRSDVKTTLRSTSKLLDRMYSFGLTDISAQAGMDYYTVPRQWGYRAGMKLGSDENFWLLQLKTLNETSLSDLQKGFYIGKDMGLRLGMINKKPGFGLDYKPFTNLKFGTSIYDLDNLEAEFDTEIELIKNVRLVGEATDLLRQNQSYSVGIKINN